MHKVNVQKSLVFININIFIVSVNQSTIKSYCAKFDGFGRHSPKRANADTVLLKNIIVLGRFNAYL